MRRIVAIVAGLVLTTVLGAAEMSHTVDTIDQVKQAVAAGGALIVDVREQDEWAAGHLAQARLVTLSGLKAGQIPADLPKDKPLYLHCRAGQRCLAAGQILKAQGYDVRPLKQGYGELVGLGFPSTK